VCRATLSKGLRRDLDIEFKMEATERILEAIEKIVLAEILLYDASLRSGISSRVMKRAEL